MAGEGIKLSHNDGGQVLCTCANPALFTSLRCLSFLAMLTDFKHFHAPILLACAHIQLNQV